MLCSLCILSTKICLPQKRQPAMSLCTSNHIIISINFFYDVPLSYVGYVIVHVIDNTYMYMYIQHVQQV